MKRIWITGALGHVGLALEKLLDCTAYEILATDVGEVDVTNQEEVERYVAFNRPDVIINCAGMTNVEACEKNPDQAYKVNAIGPRNLAAAAESIEAKMIQISTDDVFDRVSETPYNEFDDVHPKSVYGKSKYAGERMVKDLMNRYVIIRSSWVYGTGKDFVTEVLQAAKTGEKIMAANNSYASPTSAKELAKTLIPFIENDCYGIYHAVCKGSCSRYDFAREILKLSGNADKVEVYPIVDTEGKRPEYSVLDNMMLRISGLPTPTDWKSALEEFLKEMGGQI